jgi:hypothetical protein
MWGGLLQDTVSPNGRHGSFLLFDDYIRKPKGWKNSFFFRFYKGE